LALGAIRVCLSRSKGDKLRIDLFQIYDDGVLALILRELHRIEELHMTRCSSASVFRLAVEWKRPAPLLHTFRADNSDLEREAFLSLPYGTLFSHAVPNLRDLKLSAVPSDWFQNFSCLSGVERLDVCFNWFRPGPILSMLDGLPQLLWLNIDLVERETRASALYSYRREQSATMPHLGYLSLGCTAQALAVILQHLNAPCLSQLHLRLGRGSDYLTEEIEHCQVFSSAIRELRGSSNMLFSSFKCLDISDYTIRAFGGPSVDKQFSLAMDASIMALGFEQFWVNSMVPHLLYALESSLSNITHLRFASRHQMRHRWPGGDKVDPAWVNIAAKFVSLDELELWYWNMPIPLVQEDYKAEHHLYPALRKLLIVNGGSQTPKIEAWASFRGIPNVSISPNLV
jgi:hypothetical protein